MMMYDHGEFQTANDLLRSRQLLAQPGTLVSYPDRTSNNPGVDALGRMNCNQPEQQH